MQATVVAVILRRRYHLVVSPSRLAKEIFDEIHGEIERDETVDVIAGRVIMITHLIWARVNQQAPVCATCRHQAVAIVQREEYEVVFFGVHSVEKCAKIRGILHSQQLSQRWIHEQQLSVAILLILLSQIFVIESYYGIVQPVGSLQQVHVRYSEQTVMVT